MRVLPSHLLWIFLGEFYLCICTAFIRQQCQNLNLFIEVIQICDDPAISHSSNYKICKQGNLLHFIHHFLGHSAHSVRLVCRRPFIVSTLNERVRFALTWRTRFQWTTHHFDFSTFCRISLNIRMNTERKSNTISMTLLAQQGSNLIYSIRREAFIQRLSTRLSRLFCCCSLLSSYFAIAVAQIERVKWKKLMRIHQSVS